MLKSKLRVPRVRGLARTRLGQVVARLADQRLALVVAPAGSGKTTLLAQFAAAADGPVAWYRAESDDSSAAAVLAHLEHAVVDTLDGVVGGWNHVEDAVAALDSYDGQAALVMVDDLHAIWGTPGEHVVERVVGNLPPTVTLVAASRRPPSFNISRLRVSGDVLELGAEDLRFRSWEVESLFREYYGEPLLPEELAELARRTEGWAAGLQLFHLATTGKSMADRRRVLQELGTRSRLVREYLTANVIDELPDDVRRFLLDTCVLGRLTPALCDEVRQAGDSAALLATLEQRQIFTQPLDEEGAFRYHEVLRSHLEAALVEEVGEAAARTRYRDAGAALERAGALPEALRAYSRGEDWEAATRLLGRRGEQVIEDRAGWIDALPQALLDQDPWLMLGRARRYAGSGRWRDALASYQRAEAGFGGGPAGETARRERLALASWLEPVFVAPSDWTGLLRIASRRNPQSTRHQVASTDGVPGLFASGITALLSGALPEARRLFDAAAARADASPVLSVSSMIAGGVAALVAGDRVAATQLDAAAEQAESHGLGWIAWVARAARRLDPAGPEAADIVEPPAADDAWGIALHHLFAGIGDLRAGGHPVDVLDAAASDFRRLGAGALEAWARAGHALAVARAGAADARNVARSAESFTRSSGVQGALALVYAALSEAEAERAPEHRALAEGVATECGIDLSGLLGLDARPVPGYDPLGPPAAVVGPLVGREREMAELRALVDAAVAGSGRLVTIAGESGIGKTRLAEEVAIHACGRGARVLWGRASEGAPAFWPWAQVLRTFILTSDLNAVETELNGDIPALSLVVPELAELLPNQSIDNGQATEISRFNIFRAIADVIVRAAAEQPLVVILDDLHWGDASSAALLQFVARTLSAEPILVVAAHRDRGGDRSDPVMAALAELTSASRIELGGLGEAEVAEFMERLAGATPPAPLARAVSEKTGGNPFFVQETVRLLVAEGRYDDDTIVSADQLHVSAGVHDVVSRRLAGVSERCQGVLAAAAVVGRSFALRMLERVTGLAGVQVLGLVGEAVGANLAEEVFPEAGRYRFSHALIQESIYDRLSAVERTGLHRKVAEALEEAAGAYVDPRLPELAHHFLRAAAGGGDGGKAIEYAIRAGEQATRTGAYDEAVRHCEAALELVDAGDVSGDRRAEVLLTLGRLLGRRGSAADRARSVQLGEEAAAIARHLALAGIAARAEELIAGLRVGDDVDAGTVDSGSPLTIRCLGRFHLSINGSPVDIAGVKPRPRSLLRLLVSRAGRPVHREELVEALWPADGDGKAATRNLQVAISTVRHLLEPGVARGEASLVVRDGDAYRLALPDVADVDVVTFERSADAGRIARGGGDLAGAAASFASALAVYCGDLLPEEGPAEWVVKDRERLRLEAAEVAQSLAEIRLEQGDAALAAAAGERGLQIDRYRDGLWRLVIAAYDAAGDQAAAARARRAYDEVLAELGVS